MQTQGHSASHTFWLLSWWDYSREIKPSNPYPVDAAISAARANTLLQRFLQRKSTKKQDTQQTHKVRPTDLAGFSPHKSFVRYHAGQRCRTGTHILFLGHGARHLLPLRPRQRHRLLTRGKKTRNTSQSTARRAGAAQQAPRATALGTMPRGSAAGLCTNAHTCTAARAAPFSFGMEFRVGQTRSNVFLQFFKKKIFPGLIFPPFFTHVYF